MTKGKLSEIKFESSWNASHLIHNYKSTLFELPNRRSSQIPDARMFRLGRRDTGEVLGHVVAHAAAERVVIFTSRVLQVVVPLVVEHLVRSQIHCRIQQSESWEKPSKTAEDERFDKTDDVEKLPTLNIDAVDGKEDGDGAVDRHGQGEHKEPATIPESNTVVDIGAVMVKLGNATVTDPAVLRS